MATFILKPGRQTNQACLILDVTCKVKKTLSSSLSTR